VIGFKKTANFGGKLCNNLGRSNRRNPGEELIKIYSISRHFIETAELIADCERIAPIINFFKSAQRSGSNQHDLSFALLTVCLIDLWFACLLSEPFKERRLSGSSHC
jgi:hypothetical protein